MNPTLAHGTHRALTGRREATVELGPPSTWPASELARVRAQARGLARARARRQAPGVAALATAAATVASLLGVGVLEAVGAGVLGVVGWWAHHVGGEPPVVARWRAWARDRRALERELRLLGPQWRLLWDRRVNGLPGPAILAVGPSGAWVLWWPEPGIDSHADPAAAATAVYESGRLPAVAHVLRLAEGGIREFVGEIACAAAIASPDDIACAAERLNTMLLQEPVGVGL